tara:strand:+ start:13117 stop:13566 length:450 start_codon:yes stop_codon:yes gene_type:complete
MGLFDGGPECRPPQEYDSYECWRRYWEPKFQSAVRIAKFNAATIASKVRKQGESLGAFTSIQTKLSQDRINKLSKETRERWLKVAKSQAGVTGKLGGEFKADEAFITPPKAKKIKVKTAPSVQIAGLESKAVSEGTYRQGRFKNETRPR